MFEVRIHGRGGQGVVTAAELLSVAAFLAGKHSQAFPTFGSERMGAPVTAFCRISDKPIRSREPAGQPDALIIQDPTLLHHVPVFDGLRETGYVLINSTRTIEELGLGDLLQKVTSDRCATVPATQLAMERVGRPLPNAALLGAFAAMTNRVAIEFIESAVRERFPGRIGEANAAAARAAYELVLKKNITHAQVETSRAVAETIALCRPEVVCAYPITPQTHIVEGLAELVKAGELKNCEFINVESEFAALSVAIGASAAGARAYTATASQGLLFMAEAVYNASGLGLPIVMTIGNRAIGAPINIWNDHSDSMAMRDSGWIQLHAETAQEAADLHVLAFRIAEQLSCPVMVCIDGFVLTHSYEAVDVPSQKEVDAFLPRFEPRQVLDPADPVTIGAMVGPEAFMEVRYLQHHNLIRALEIIPELSRSFQHQFGRECGDLLRKCHMDDADTVVVALDSVNGTIKDVIDEMREDGSSVGLLSICCYRPFPFAAVRTVLGHARRVLVLEKSLAPGVGGVVSNDIQTALAGMKVRIMTAIAGLGGRPITKTSLRELFDRVERATLEPLTFMDLNAQSIQRFLEQQNHSRRSGPANAQPKVSELAPQVS